MPSSVNFCSFSVSVRVLIPMSDFSSSQKRDGVRRMSRRISIVHASERTAAIFCIGQLAWLWSSVSEGFILCDYANYTIFRPFLVLFILGIFS